MQKYVCEFCGYEYDPEVGDPDSGIAPGTAFEDIPEDWKVECVIALGYSDFEPKPLPEWDSEASILWHTKEQGVVRGVRGVRV